MSAASVIDEAERRRFMPLEFRALEDAGFFGPDGGVYLQDGIIRDLATSQPHRFTADELQRMSELGFFDLDDEADRVELIGGVIYAMARHSAAHASGVNRLNMMLAPRLAGRASVIVQCPIELGLEDEPQPDVTIARFRPDGYATGHPNPEDVHLVIEVMYSSVHHDRVLKLPHFAESGIGEVWLVNLERPEIEVCRDPEGEDYRSRSVVLTGAISPRAFPDVQLSVDEILNRVPPP
jgi:Uma2 family endonuclease